MSCSIARQENSARYLHETHHSIFIRAQRPTSPSWLKSRIFSGKCGLTIIGWMCCGSAKPENVHNTNTVTITRLWSAYAYYTGNFSNFIDPLQRPPFSYVTLALDCQLHMFETMKHSARKANLQPRRVSRWTLVGHLKISHRNSSFCRKHDAYITIEPRKN